MRKIISLFKRNYGGDRLVYNEVVPGAEWVINGEGVATKKFDGTCCMIRDGILYKRYTLKKGRKPPQGFEPVTDIDPNTGKRQGWVPVSAENPSDKWHIKGLCNTIEISGKLADGTYELCGPNIQGNPECLGRHMLIEHGKWILDGTTSPPRTFDELREWFIGKDIEGIVWHHPDGRMVKIKKRDFGFRREE